MNLLNLIFKNRPSQSLEFLSRIGVGFDHPNDSELGLRSYLERLAYAAGVNHIVQVNDCEDNGGYTESDNGVFDLETFAATGKRVGTNCLLMTETAACDNSQYIQTTYINESKPVPVYFGKRQMDWRDTRYLGFWIHNAADTGAFGTTGELQVAIVSGGVVQTKVQITGLTDAVHQWVEIDMTSSDVDWDLSKVESLRFYCNNANTGETVYIDDIIRYQLSYNNAPLYGCALPIKSTVIVPDGVNIGWSADGAILGSATEAVTDLGMGKIFGATSLTGTAKRDKWVMIPGLQIFIARASGATVAGEGVIFSAARTVEGCSTGVDEKAHAKCLEAAGAANDDIFCVRGLGNHFIS